MDNRIKLRHLTCFTEACRQQGISKAADVLSLTQPAVSKAIRELEEILGSTLLTRSKKGVVLTDYGRVFLNYANHALAVLNEGILSVTDNKNLSATSLTIGALPSVSASILPTAVKQFRITGAHNLVRIITGTNAFLLEQLRVGSIDILFGLLAAPGKMTDLSFMPLYSEHLSLVVRPRHPLLKKNASALNNLANFPALLPISESITRQTVDQWLIEHGIREFPDRVETASASFGRQYVIETDAIWYISHGVVRTDIADGKLKTLAVDTSNTGSSVGLTTRADYRPDDASRRFIDLLRSITKPFEAH